MMRFKSTEIYEAIRSGDDSKVLSYLYGSMLPKIRNHIGKNGGTKEDADDIFQEAVLRLYKSQVEGKLENIANIEGFLFQIAKNLWIDLVKSKTKISQFTPQEIEVRCKDNNAEDQILAAEKSNALIELFQLVGEKCLRIMEMHLFEKKSMEDIAELMGLANADAVKAQHYRCKQKLIQLINERQDINRTINY